MVVVVVRQEPAPWGWEVGWSRMELLPKAGLSEGAPWVLGAVRGAPGSQMQGVKECSSWGPAPSSGMLASAVPGGVNARVSRGCPAPQGEVAGAEETGRVGGSPRRGSLAPRRSSLIPLASSQQTEDGWASCLAKPHPPEAWPRESTGPREGPEGWLAPGRWEGSSSPRGPPSARLTIQQEQDFPGQPPPQVLE